MLRGEPSSLPSLEPPSRTTPVAADPGTAILEGAVDSLRRLLSELLERRMESVVSDLVAIRGEALALPAVARGPGGIVERLEEMLTSLGAVRFDAEPMALLDPLIHTIASERYEEGVPDGVILETVRPGYRSARRVVLCKAAVVVNRRN